jgi:hypothetical protein
MDIPLAEKHKARCPKDEVFDNASDRFLGLRKRQISHFWHDVWNMLKKYIDSADTLKHLTETSILIRMYSDVEHTVNIFFSTQIPFRLQYSTVQYSTVQYSTVQYSTVQYSTVQYSTVQYCTVQYSTVQYSTVQYSTLQYNIIDYT